MATHLLRCSFAANNGNRQLARKAVLAGCVPNQQRVSIITDREQETMAGSWTEYLCLEGREEGKIQLTIMVYSFLGETSEYADEETGEILLPAEINGRKVVGVHDDRIIGEPLATHPLYPEHDVLNSTREETRRWLAENWRSGDALVLASRVDFLARALAPLWSNE